MKNFWGESINLKGTIHNKREVNESSFFMISIIDIFQKSIFNKIVSMVVNCCTQIFIKKFNIYFYFVIEIFLHFDATGALWLIPQHQMH